MKKKLDNKKKPVFIKNNKKNNIFDKKKNDSLFLKPLIVWGKHIVESFLNNISQTKQNTGLNKSYYLHIIVDKSGKVPSQLAHVHELAKLLKIKTISHSHENTWPLADIQESIVHQRVCLQIPTYPTEDLVSACETIQILNEKKQFGCAGIILDHIQDPRNFGAILRSAAFFGVKFVIYPQNRQANISSLVVKASAGGIFSLTLIPVVNINRAIKQLKESGAWILGTENSDDAKNIHELPTDRVWVSIFGNEGSGISSEVLKNCDYTVKIPGGTNTLDSLNVSVAAGILFHSLQNT